MDKCIRFGWPTSRNLGRSVARPRHLVAPPSSPHALPPLRNNAHHFEVALRGTVADVVDDDRLSATAISAARRRRRRSWDRRAPPIRQSRSDRLSVIMAHFHFAVAVAAVLGLMALGIRGESRPAVDKSQLSQHHIFFTFTISPSPIFLHFSPLKQPIRRSLVT